MSGPDSNYSVCIEAASSFISWPFAETGKKIKTEIWPTEPGWRHGQFLYYLDTVYTIHKDVELASRLVVLTRSAPPLWLCRLI